MAIDERLIPLAYAYLDQQMGPEKLSELEAILRESDAARLQFARMVSMHRHLFEQYRVQDLMDHMDDSEEDVAESLDYGTLMQSLLAAEESAAAMVVHIEPPAEPVEPELRLVTDDTENQGPRVVVIPVWLVGGAAIAAVLAIALVITAFLPGRSAPTGMADAQAPEAEQPVAPAPQAPAFYAAVIDTARPVGSLTPPTYRIGDRLHGRVELTGDEFVELRLQNGVHVVLQGPLLADLQGPQNMFLDQGEVVVDVSDSNGDYIVATDSAVFRDLGTVFAVTRHAAGQAELFVLEGEVEARREMPDGEVQTLSVHGGQTAMVRDTESLISISNYIARDFSRNGREARQRYRADEISEALLAYWRFEPEQVVASPLPHSAGATENRPAIRDASGNGNDLFVWDEMDSPVVSSDRLPAGLIPGNKLRNRQSIYLPGFQGDRFNDVFMWSPFTNPKDGRNLQQPDWDEWTVELSFWPESLNEKQTILGLDGEYMIGGELQPAFACQLVDGRLIVTVMDGSGIQRQVVSSQPIMPRDWSHLAVVFTQNEMRLFVKTARSNRYLDAGRTPMVGGMIVPEPRSWDGLPHTWSVGRGMHERSFSNSYRGYVDEVRFTKLALREDELLFAPQAE